MCGISGVLSLSPTEPPDREILLEMNRRLAHRGPDHQGVLVDGPMGLANCRLAIVDRAAHGRQPMQTQDGAFALTFNGEIYNHRALRRELEAEGCAFRTDTDTEVLLQILRRYGPAGLPRLRGMFALAAWDGEARSLLLATDRHGKKPLYWTLHGRRILFASEPKALVADGSLPRRLDLHALDDYLRLGYVPPPRTAFEGISKIAPGHALLVKGGTVEPFRWSPGDASEPQGAQGGRRARQVAAATLRQHLLEAVRTRVPDEVPFGVFLSGGLDSATIVAALGELGHRGVPTFTIGFEDAAFDERDAARTVARHFQTEHHEEVLTAVSPETLERLAWAFDEPFADASAVPTWHLARLARSRVVVALTGDGSDELFGGYDRYRGLLWARAWQVLPRRVRARLGATFRRGVRSTRIARFLAAADLPPACRYARWMTLMTAGERARLYTPEVLQQVLGFGRGDDGVATAELEAPGDGVSSAMELDLRTYLPGDLLVKMDRATMAFGLEARSPFLDAAVDSFARSLPRPLKVGPLQGKRILREAMRDLLPPAIRGRKKHGFGAPIGHWLRSSLAPCARELLLSEGARRRGLFQTSEVQRLLSEHQASVADHAPKLWALMMLELWHRTFLDGLARRPSSLPPGPAGI